ERVAVEDVDLPRIPVQPMGWGAAREILERMGGGEAPEAWRGGLELTYRMGGDDAVRVALAVEQRRALMKTANVIGTLRGTRPDAPEIVFGAHHDAWEYGAHDPTAGTILVLEAARVFGEMAQRGMRPERTVRFACWGAEEYGIFGSSEWVEANEERLRGNALAYVNADASTFGMNFRAGATPPLHEVLRLSAEDVYRAMLMEGDAEIEGEDARIPTFGFGDLGGGSDHVGFLCHAGVPSASVGSSGARGSAYHSSYDNLRWYRQTVGDDYEPAALLTRIVGLFIARLANADLAPLDPSAMVADAARRLDEIETEAEEAGLDAEFAWARAVADAWVEASGRAYAEARARMERGEMGEEELAAWERAAVALPRLWLMDEGLPERAWFRNTFAAPDENSGYAAWVLPWLRRAVEMESQAELDAATAALEEVMRRHLDALRFEAAAQEGAE
ncbi:MAG: M28 family peptidase, partial [Planctomycetota bacterium]|nr:M28 family peptidase [Planctomycetota bacterium]